MTHYSGNDPEKGCGLMIVGAIVVILLIALLFILGNLIPRLTEAMLRVLP